MAGLEKGKLVGGNQLLAGKWMNELGSAMIIKPSTNESFEGLYETKVGTGEIKYVPLYGVMNPRNTANPTATFCIAWNSIEKDSCSAFVGQYFTDCEVEKLLTMWLLREAEHRECDNWEATMVGKNIFRKVPEDPLDKSVG